MKPFGINSESHPDYYFAIFLTGEDLKKLFLANKEHNLGISQINMIEIDTVEDHVNAIKLVKLLDQVSDIPLNQIIEFINKCKHEPKG